MANLNEILENANGGEAISILGRELELTPEQTQSAITALLPAISSGLKQSTSSVDGLGNLFALMGQQKDLPGLFDDAKMALSPDGIAAGNQALSLIFGSQEVNQAIVDQAQKFSGVSSSVLEQAVAGAHRNRRFRTDAQRISRNCASVGGAQAAMSPLGAGGGLGDILGQVFGRVLTGGGAPAPAPSSGGAGPLGDILGQIFGQGAGPGGATAPAPQGSPFPSPANTGGGQAAPGGDLLSMIFREVLKGIQNGSIKPVIIGGGGPIQIPMPGGPGGQDGSGAPQVPGGDIFGKILRDVLGGALGGGAGGGGSAQMPQGGGAQIPQMPTASANASAKGPDGRSVGSDEAARRDGRRGRCGLRRSPPSRPGCRPEPSRQHSRHPRSSRALTGR